jgi:hypothetical protein
MVIARRELGRAAKRAEQDLEEAGREPAKAVG